MAEQSPHMPYETPDAWLADASALFGARMGDHLGICHANATSEARLVGLVQTAEARALAAQIAAGRPQIAPESGARQALARRLQDPAALAALPIGQMLARFALSVDWALPLALICAVQSDTRFARLLAWLNDDAQRRYLTPSLCAVLCGPDTPDPGFWGRHELVQLRCLVLADHPDQLPGDRAVRLTTPVLAFLLGQTPQDLNLAGLMTSAPTLPLDQLLGAVPNIPHQGCFVVIGPDGAGRRAVAASVMVQRGMASRTISATSVTAAPRDLLARALRDRALADTALIVTDAHRLDICDLRWLIDLAPGALALTSADRLPLDLAHLRVPELDTVRSSRLWTARLGTDRAPEAGQLAHQYRLCVDDILSIPAGPARGLSAIRRDCLDRSAGTLSRLATVVPCRHDWDDLVLPARQLAGLHAIVTRARHARDVYDDWGFGRKLVPNRGLSALFSGPSGSGKTLSASVVARAIGLPLYRVDLSSTVSKYIGETEKNLERIFSAAESANACLLFDECDALFGKRSDVSDAHDRYANIETSYLLQRMESHRGIVLMSSNHPQNIDEAFMRRIDLAIEYALPDVALRQALWQRLMPPEAGADIDAARLGAQFELSGGSIRNCLVTAAFLASEGGTHITTDHCVRAVALEYEKTRRPLTRAEFGDAYPALRARKGA